tara:strand:+ start:54 stop:344 length:291 start_codon:yes stop_codon:yes gene_type:complete
MNIDFKQLWENYKLPTPQTARVVGDWLLLITAIAGIVLPMFTGIPAWVGAVVTLLGIGGKFLTNFKAPKTSKDVLDIVSKLPKVVKDFKDATNKKL